MKLKKLIITLISSLVLVCSFVLPAFAWDVEENVDNTNIPSMVANAYYHTYRSLAFDKGVNSSFYIGSCSTNSNSGFHSWSGNMYYLTDDTVISVSKVYTVDSGDFSTLFIEFNMSDYYVKSVNAGYSSFKYNNPAYISDTQSFTIKLYSDYSLGRSITSTNFPIDDLYQYASSLDLSIPGRYSYHSMYPSDTTNITASGYYANESLTVTEDMLTIHDLGFPKNENGLYNCQYCGAETEEIYHIRHLGYVCPDCYVQLTGTLPDDELLFDDTTPFVETGIEWLDKFLNSFSTSVAMGEKTFFTLIQECTGFFDMISEFFSTVPAYVWNCITFGIVVAVILRVLGR